MHVFQAGGGQAETTPAEGGATAARSLGISFFNSSMPPFLDYASSVFLD
jgi:hypothetical protein